MKEYQTSEMDILLSPEALEVWKMLDATTKRTIQKDFPIKAKRNLEIVRLKREGVPVKLLMELSGLGKGAVIDITRGVKVGANAQRHFGKLGSQTGNTYEIINLLKSLQAGQVEIKNAILSIRKGK